MYCKYCGRQLKEGMRFCDRCGKSVRQSQESSREQKQREIEELKAERLNRKKRLAEKEAKQAEKKKRQKKNRSGFIFFLVILLIAIVSIIIGYNIFPKSTNTTGTTETAEPSSTASSQVVSPSPAASGDTYSEVEIGNILCPYPASFHSNTTTGNEVINLTDSLGGATMVVSKEATSGEITDLLKDYIDEINATDNPEMTGGNDWYGVTAEVDGKVHHRKCIVRNSLAVYYDFTYDAASSSSKKYEDYIKYIDSKFK